MYNKNTDKYIHSKPATRRILVHQQTKHEIANKSVLKIFMIKGFSITFQGSDKYLGAKDLMIKIQIEIVHTIENMIKHRPSMTINFRVLYNI